MVAASVKRTPSSNFLVRCARILEGVTDPAMASRLAGEKWRAEAGEVGEGLLATARRRKRSCACCGGTTTAIADTHSLGHGKGELREAAAEADPAARLGSAWRRSSRGSPGRRRELHQPTGANH